MANKPPIQKLTPEQHVYPDVSADQSYRIGRVILLWSKLEAAIDDLLWTMLTLDIDDGRTVTNKLSIDSKIQILRTIGTRRLTNDPALAAFQKTMGRIEELKDPRNFIAHGNWGTLRPNEIPVAASLKPKTDAGEIVSETFTQERMEGICGGISVARNVLNALRNQIEAQRKQQQQPHLPENPSLRSPTEDQTPEAPQPPPPSYPA